MLGLELGTYPAYCLDQAVWYLGTTIKAELNKVGQKRDKKAAANEAARLQRLKKLLGTEETGNSGFADPAALFA